MEEECCFMEDVAAERLWRLLDLKQVKSPPEDPPQIYSPFVFVPQSWKIKVSVS